MAIFGVGSTWEGDERKEEFFADENFKIGWDYKSAKDLYDAVFLLKAGDIIYLNSSSPSSRKLRIKGIGVVTKSFIHGLIEKGLTKKEIFAPESFSVKIKWMFKGEFPIIIPKSEGRLTHVRAGTFYEEYLPYVQKQIIDKLFNLKP
jgi:hypothetical protein